ncbi:hypothetical protein CDAR_201111 [Caerostris darwini]|uniref:Uncharacterized protein n=1 Tax=Caerostris darwini TaxID=1538125 RepID=A0AAV4P4N1_9ARAC|nr:hypothetical protein CDAR_201111 [Caerostris darwini]
MLIRLDGAGSRSVAQEGEWPGSTRGSWLTLNPAFLFTTCVFSFQQRRRGMNKLSWRNILPFWKLGYVTGRLVRARVARFRDTREECTKSLRSNFRMEHATRGRTRCEHCTGLNGIGRARRTSARRRTVGKI